MATLGPVHSFLLFFTYVFLNVCLTIMAPWHVDILQATVWFVDSIFSAEKRQKEGKIWELNQKCAGYAGNNLNTSIEKYF